jgi:hypothetical protein
MTDPILVFFAAWLVPGAGHYLLGQRWRGVAFFVAIVASFALGEVVTQGFAVSPREHTLAFFGQVFAGVPFGVGWAIDALRAHTSEGAGFGGLGNHGMSDAVIARIDLGLVFTMVAGLLNLLLALDATDRANAARRGDAA